MGERCIHTTNRHTSYMYHGNNNQSRTNANSLIILSPLKKPDYIYARDNASAFAFAVPLRCTMSKVYSWSIKLHLSKRWFLEFIEFSQRIGL